MTKATDPAYPVREIKYRGYCTNLNGWIYGSLIHDGKGNYSISHGFDNTWYDVEAESVGQFTDGQDKHGRDIYEGDVLKSFPTLRYKDEVIISVVKWDSRRLLWVAIETKYNETEYLFEALSEPHATEIIGNRFQHPELIEQLNREDGK